MGGLGTAAVGCWAGSQLYSTLTHPTSLGRGVSPLGVWGGNETGGPTVPADGGSESRMVDGGGGSWLFGRLRSLPCWLAIPSRWERETGRYSAWKPAWRPASEILGGRLWRVAATRNPWRLRCQAISGASVAGLVSPKPNRHGGGVWSGHQHTHTSNFIRVHMGTVDQFQFRVKLIFLEERGF